jgi:hypothetical protein
MKGSVKNTPIQQPINPTIDPIMATIIKKDQGCFDTIENYIL